jgi:beta-glucanase (GH16 family)
LDCIEVKDDKLHLYVKDNPDSEYKLKTGWLNSTIWEDIGFEQAYGYFEIRCKPPTQGMKWWTAFWLYGNGWPPEIDIFEFMGTSDVGKDYTKSITFTDHFGNPGKKGNQKFLGTQLGRNLKGIDWSKEFHTYACKWQYDYVQFYIDNIAVYRIIYNVPTNKMNILVNTAGNLKHLPKPEELPGEFIVDYIRVYEKIY